MCFQSNIHQQHGVIHFSYIRAQIRTDHSFIFNTSLHSVFDMLSAETLLYSNG